MHSVSPRNATEECASFESSPCPCAFCRLARTPRRQAQHQEKNSLAPPIANKKGGGINRKVKNILRRRGDQKGEASQSAQQQNQNDVVEAAILIQSAARAKRARKEVQRKRKKAQKRTKYDTFSVGDVRAELAKNDMLPSLPSNMKKLPQMGGLSAMRPTRLAPINASGPSRLPPISKPPGNDGMPSMPSMMR